MRIVPPWIVWPQRTLLRNCFVFGLGSFLPATLVTCVLGFWLDSSRYPKPNKPIYFGSLLIASVLTAIVFAALIHWRIQLETLRRRVLAILMVAAGAMLVPLLIWIVLCATGFLSNPFASNFTVAALLAWCGAYVSLILVWHLLAALAWPLIRRKYKFIIQDGATCPECAYCVRGVASAICPECGSAFDHTQLGLGIEQFDRLISGETITIRRAGDD